MLRVGIPRNSCEFQVLLAINLEFLGISRNFLGISRFFRTRVVMVGNYQSEFGVKIHTFIPRNS